MGLVKTSGSVSGTSSPVENKYVVSPDPNNPAAETRALDKRYVKDTFSFANELSSDRMKDILGQLRAYAAGGRIKVTYFKQTQTREDTEGVTQHGVEVAVLDPVHTSMYRIYNFELILRQAMDFSYSPDAVLSEFKGEALVYPGFRPSKGDLFIYTMTDGQAALFSITDVPERLSIRANTYHTIKFEMEQIVDDKVLEKLNTCVIDDAWFDLERFLMEEGALLKSEEYMLLGQVAEWFVTLTVYYIDAFYDRKDYVSLVRPDKIYDPYVTEFIKYVIPYELLSDPPHQLLSPPPYWRRSLWWRILYPSQVTPNLLVNNCVVAKKKVGYMTSVTNALANRYYIALGASDGSGASYGDYLNWIFGNSPSSDISVNGSCPARPHCGWYWNQVYHKDKITVDANTEGEPSSEEDTKAFLDMLQQYFNDQTIDAKVLMDLVRKFDQMSRSQQFYRIPVLLAFMNKVTDSLKSGKQMLSNVKGSVSNETNQTP